MTPPSFGHGSRSIVMQRARACQRAAENSSEIARYCSSLARLTSSTPFSARIARPIASTSAGVFPAPKITSGKAAPARTIGIHTRKAEIDKAVSHQAAGGSLVLRINRIGIILDSTKPCPRKELEALIIQPVREQRDAAEIFLPGVLNAMPQQLAAKAVRAVFAVHDHVFEHNHKATFRRADREKQIDHPEVVRFAAARKCGRDWAARG